MSIPSNIRVPFVYLEFDPSNAFQGPSLLPYVTLLIGQRTSGGSVAELVRKQITRDGQGSEFFGVGSQLDRMITRYRSIDKVSTVYAIALDDAVGAVAAEGTLSFTGTATAAGQVYLYIGGTLVQVGVSEANTASDVAAAVETAVNADTSLPVTAAAAIGDVVLTAKNGGTEGNSIDVRVNYNEGEDLPAGISLTIAAMGATTAGSGDPDIQDVLDVLGDEWYQVLAAPYTDTNNLSAVDVFLTARFGPLQQIDGTYFSAKRGTQAELTAFGNALNSEHICVMGMDNVPDGVSETSALVAAQAAYEGAQDPARPFQTLELVGMKQPSITDRFTWEERNTLLYDGVSTMKDGPGGVRQIERLITTYQKNAAGAADIAYLNVNTLFTLRYLRYDLRTMFLLKYSRAKLADDGNEIAAGQQVITPSVAKAEIVAKFRDWQSLGLVENIDQFKRDLVVERSSTDPDRLDIFLSPDLINQFRVGAGEIQFLLQSAA